MLSAPIPEFEGLRLQTLHDQQILDTEPEEGFDAVTELVADLFDAPISLVSLVDEDRQWFKSRVGLARTETPRRHSFCAHSVASREMLVVEDTLNDRRFVDNPLVVGDPNIRFYAGAPVYAGDRSLPLGNLCVVDRQPRRFSGADRRRLELLARQVDAQIMLRSADRRSRNVDGLARRLLGSVDTRLRTPIDGIEGVSDLLALTDLDRNQLQYLEVIRAWAAQLDTTVATLISTAVADDPSHEPTLRRFDLGDVLVMVLQAVGQTARRKGVNLELNWDPRTSAIRFGDPDWLRALLMNLMENTLTFADPGSVILEVSGTEQVRFDIRNRVVGIPPYHVERVNGTLGEFGGGPTVPSYEGFGLGWAVAHQAADLLGATLSAAWDPAEGSVLTAVVPLPSIRPVSAERARPVVAGVRRSDS